MPQVTLMLMCLVLQVVADTNISAIACQVESMSSCSSSTANLEAQSSEPE